MRFHQFFISVFFVSRPRILGEGAIPIFPDTTPGQGRSGPAGAFRGVLRGFPDLNEKRHSRIFCRLQASQRPHRAFATGGQKGETVHNWYYSECVHIAQKQCFTFVCFDEQKKKDFH